MEDVINKFNLIQLYSAEDVEEAIEILTENVEYEIESEGTIRITSYVSTDWFHPANQEESSKFLSADIVNYYIERLNILNVKLKSEHASFQRAFIEERYNQNIYDLQVAEENLKIFQEEHNMVSLEEQTTAAIEVATELISRISIDEVKLQTLKQTLPAEHPEIKILLSEIAELNVQLEALDNGDKEMTLIPGFSKVPSLSLELRRLFRDVKVHNTLYTFLTQQFEDAKIQEARNTPTIQVLDPAIPPVKKTRPRIILFVVSTFLICAIGNALTIILYVNYKSNH